MNILSLYKTAQRLGPTPPLIILPTSRWTVHGQMRQWPQSNGGKWLLLSKVLTHKLKFLGNEWICIITSKTRSFQASWKWVPKRSPAPPWSVGSTDVRPKHTKNMNPPLIISCALDLINPDKSVWNCFLYALVVASFAPWMNTLPLLKAGDFLSTTLSGIWNIKLKIFMNIKFPFLHETSKKKKIVGGWVGTIILGNKLALSLLWLLKMVGY